MFNLGVAQDHQAKYAEAAQAFRKSIEAAHNTTDAFKAAALWNLGSSLKWSGKPAEALDTYRRAFDQQSDNPDIWSKFGLQLRDAGLLSEAETVARRAIDRWPGDPRGWQSLGAALGDQAAHGDARKLPEAVTTLQRAIYLKSDFALAHFDLGKALLLQNHRDEGVVELRKSIALDPDNHMAYYNLAHALQFQGKTAEAARTYRQAFGLFSRSRFLYNAACTSALAGCGQGNDADKLDTAERSRLRQQSLTWLAAEFATWTKRADTPAERPKIRQTMQHWQNDTDFAGVRGAEELAKLPEAERAAWQKLWADVAALRRRCEEPSAAAKPPRS
jgi:tetratricopeptide (TPR) repeat protein